MIFQNPKVTLTPTCSPLESDVPPTYSVSDSCDYSPTALSHRSSASGPHIVPLVSADGPVPSRPVLIRLNKAKKFSATPFTYNVFDKTANPLKTVHDCLTLRLETKLDSNTVYLPGLNSSLDDELESQKASLSGHLVLTVKSTSLVIQDLTVRLNGYSTEFLCVLDNDQIEKVNEDGTTVNKSNLESQVRLFREGPDKRPSYYDPFITDEIACFDKFPIVLTKGTYSIPFTFILDSRKHHASYRSMRGSTTYRVETSLTLLPEGGRRGSASFGMFFPKPEPELIFLTQECKMVKTIPYSTMLQNQSVEDQGFLKKENTDYSFYLSSKVLEIGKPFQCTLNLIAPPETKLLKVDVKLLQKMTIPIVTTDMCTPVGKIYAKNQFFQLHSFEQPANAVSNTINVKFDNIVISDERDNGILAKNILPTYCEASRLKRPTKDSKIAKLETSHHVIITATAAVPVGADHADASPSKQNYKKTNINFKIPVIVLDQYMGSTLHLPAYEPETTNSKILSNCLEFSGTINCLDDCVPLVYTAAYSSTENSPDSSPTSPPRYAALYN
ncbi:hypothetical protein C6P41_001845 [Kluyveromyces marxianus]|nr:hypothetical protein C6P43_002699 [Kluyveromyces marxianus]KAG0686061.1 hypothetical protein C6P41_001845 [Kluyveromyces marxianus]